MPTSKCKDSFEATSADDTKHTIEVWTDFILDSTTIGAAEQELQEDLRCNGNKVDRIAQGKYLIVSSAIVLLSDAPNAV